MTVKIVFNHVDDITQQLAVEGGKVIAKVGSDAEATAKNEAPVDTGFLKNNIGFEMVEPTKGELSSNADYSGPVNDGTWKMPARPFFTHAVEQAKRDLLDAAQRVLGGLK